MMMMLFCNVRGLGDPTKRRIVREVITDCKADIVCLEESKLVGDSVSVLRTLGDRFTFIVQDSRGASGGVVLGVDSDKFIIGSQRIGKYMLTATLRRRMDGWPNHNGCLWPEL